MYGCQSEQPVPLCFFSRLDHLRNRCLRRLSFCPHVLVCGSAVQLGYRAARFSGMKSNSRGSLIRWATCFAVSATSNLFLGQIRKTHACRSVTCCIFLLQNVTLPTIRHTTLSCNFSRDVVTELVFALDPDSLMMSGACLKSGSMSKY